MNARSRLFVLAGFCISFGCWLYFGKPAALTDPALPPPATAALAGQETQEAPRPAAPTKKGSAGGIDVYFTGSDDGYLDACGCDDGLLGGLPRRHTLLRYEGQGEQGEKSALLLSNGRLVKDHLPLDRDKLETIVFAMQQMGYDAIALTERELALGRETLASLALLLGEDCSFVATNLVDRVAADGSPLSYVHSCVVKAKGRPVLVLSAIAASRAPLFTAADPQVEVTDPVAALKEEVAHHLDARPVVLLAQASEAEAKSLIEAVPEIGLVILEGSDEDPREEATRVGRAELVTTGVKVKFLGHFSFGAGGDDGSLKRLPIHDQLDKSEAIQDILGNYRDLLELDKPIERYFELVATRSGARYSGSDEATCAGCHPKAWEIWSKSKHAHAWKTLEDQDLPPDPTSKKGKQKHAIWDPDCVKCHVTGFGEKSGYAGLERERPEAPLINVTCEACHGPAGDHAQRASEKEDYSWPGGKIPSINGAGGNDCEKLCMRCHDPDNSPRFNRLKYWAGLVKDVQGEPIAHGKE